MNEYYTRGDVFGAPPKRDHLFLWTVFILLLIGAAMACWLGSFYVFGHPERAESYKILKKLHKIEPPKRFSITDAPAGEFLTPQKLFERYSDFTPLELQNENDELLRMYLTNYQQNQRLVPYVVGQFTIMTARSLTPDDLFPSGVAALAQAADFPQVLMEHIYTADAANVPAVGSMLRPGLAVKLSRSLDLSAVVHVQRLDNGSLQFTVVPLLYGSYKLGTGAGTFQLEPPPGVNLLAGLPVIKGPDVQTALQQFAAVQQQNAPGPSALEQPTATPAASAPPSSELVRAEQATQEISVPMGASKRKGKASPTPVAIAEATPVTARAVAAPTPRPEVAMNDDGRQPVEAPPPAPEATPSQLVAPSGVPLTPFLQSDSAPQMANSGVTWHTYSPGQMPRGRVIAPSDASALADGGLSGERLYLRGDFVVTAASDNRAVLRPQGSRSGAGSTRIIVEYPAGMLLPSEGSSVSRDVDRPYLITDVRRGADGQINVYAREITNSQ